MHVGVHGARIVREGDGSERGRHRASGRPNEWSATGLEGGDEVIEVGEVEEAIAVEVGGGIAGLEGGDEIIKVAEVDEAVVVVVGGACSGEGCRHTPRP